MTGDDRDREVYDPIEDVEPYIRFISILPDDVKQRIPNRYADPLTGEPRQYRYDNYAVLAEILHVYEELGHVPTSTEFDDCAVITAQLYENRFGTFPRAVEVVGLEPKFSGPQEKARYLANYEELADPDEMSKYSRSG